MSLLLAGLAGGAKAASGIAEKYIDEEFEMRRQANLERLADKRYERERANRKSDLDEQRTYDESQMPSYESGSDANGEWQIDTRTGEKKYIYTKPKLSAKDTRDHNREAYQKALVDLEAQRREGVFGNDDKFDNQAYLTAQAKTAAIFGYGAPTRFEPPPINDGDDTAKTKTTTKEVQDEPEEPPVRRDSTTYKSNSRGLLESAKTNAQLNKVEAMLSGKKQRRGANISHEEAMMIVTDLQAQSNLTNEERMRLDAIIEQLNK